MGASSAQVRQAPGVPNGTDHFEADPDGLADPIDVAVECAYGGDLDTAFSILQKCLEKRKTRPALDLGGGLL
ncbi:MAG: hypothetical protein AB1556_00620 [Bacillota bacterium]